MGSLVMSQVISDIGRPPAMIRAGSHQSAASETASRTAQQDASSSTTHLSASTPRPVANRETAEDTQSSSTTPIAPSQQIPPQPPSPPIRPETRPEALPDSRRPSHDARNYDQAGFPLTSDPQGLSASSPTSPRLKPTFRSTRSLGGSEATSPSRIKVRDLSHIQSMASQEMLAPRSDARSGSFLQEGRQYEISEMPVAEIIEMVAGLLTKITTTNDQQHEHLHRQIPLPEDAAGMHPQTTSVLAFHGRNVPSITILSYLSRIHKYCPTTYEVFLSLLVYFDRMTNLVNKGFMESMRQTQAVSPGSTSEGRTEAAPISPASESGDPTSPTSSENQRSFAQFFVVDSYNIHRLVIAGVTCASKFFSDVFYTNSRYAKVGGLPLMELNHLELQFLLLNDFRLSIPVEELEAYGTMLVEFYAREVIAQQQAQQQMSSSYGRDEGIYMRGSAGTTQTPTPP